GDAGFEAVRRHFSPETTENRVVNGTTEEQTRQKERQLCKVHGPLTSPGVLRRRWARRSRRRHSFQYPHRWRKFAITATLRRQLRRRVALCGSSSPTRGRLPLPERLSV